MYVPVYVIIVYTCNSNTGLRLPIGLGNDNDKFSQLVSPTGQVNQSSHTVRPRTLIGQHHQV